MVYSPNSNEGYLVGLFQKRQLFISFTWFIRPASRFSNFRAFPMSWVPKLLSLMWTMMDLIVM